MIISTASGPIRVHGRSRYGHWLRGWVASEAWSGHYTVKAAWASVKDMVEGVHDFLSCYAVGYAQGIGYQQSRCGALHEAAHMLAEARVERARQDLDDAVEDHQKRLPIEAEP